MEDARSLVRTGLVEAERLLEKYSAIEPGLIRYPAIDPASFRAAVEKFIEHQR